MLVEINLLPQREPGKFAFVAILSGIFALMILVGTFYFWQIHSTKNEISSVDKQVETARRLADKENQNTAAVEASSSVTQLKNAISWAKDYPIETIPVMNYLSSLLPERGFIQNFNYTEAGTISLQVQFDNTREAAYFLNSLNKSEWIKEASLGSLSAAQDVTAPSSGTQTETAAATQNNTQSTITITQTNPDGSTTTYTQGNPNVTDTANANQTDGPTDQGTNASNSTDPTSSTTANSTTAVSDKEADKNILPRYTGQYEIVLNKDVVKKKIKEGKKDEEGVTGS